MRRDEEKRVGKNEAYPLRYVEFFPMRFDEVAAYDSFAAVGIGFRIGSKVVAGQRCRAPDNIWCRRVARSVAAYQS